MNSKIFSGALRALIVISMLSGIFPTTSFVSADTSTSSQAPDPSSSDAIDFDYDEDIAALASRRLAPEDDEQLQAALELLK